MLVARQPGSQRTTTTTRQQKLTNNFMSHNDESFVMFDVTCSLPLSLSVSVFPSTVVSLVRYATFYEQCRKLSNLI